MKRENLSDFNIIIDEAHIILKSLSPIRFELLATLFNRTIEYKDLKLITATLRPEIIELFQRGGGYSISACQYIKNGFSPTIQLKAKRAKEKQFNKKVELNT